MSCNLAAVEPKQDACGGKLGIVTGAKYVLCCVPGRNLQHLI